MADEQLPVQQGQADEQELDYKALYERYKAESRKWEKQAKANKEAAAELQRSQDEAKGAEERIADLTRRLDEKERAEEAAKLRAKVARDKNVPADLLAGETEEELSAHADALLAHFGRKPAASSARTGSFDAGDDAGDADMREFVRSLLGRN